MWCQRTGRTAYVPMMGTSNLHIQISDWFRASRESLLEGPSKAGFYLFCGAVIEANSLQDLKARKESHVLKSMDFGIMRKGLRL